MTDLAAITTVDHMRLKLLSMDDLGYMLGQTEPISTIPFTVGNPIRFRAESGWNHGLKALSGDSRVNVFMDLGPRISHREYQLTKNAVFEMCQLFGFKNSYVEVCPAELLVPAMNYWFREGLWGKAKSKTELAFLNNNDTVMALTKQTHQPFSNLALLDQALAAIENKFGTVEVLADYKTTHDLRHTTLRLIVPNGYRLIHSDTPGDVWSTGIQIKNSLTGAGQTSFEGYLFRWVCTNGQIDTKATSGTFTRRRGATEAEVYTWARQAVDDVLGGLETSLDAVQALTGLHITGSLADTLRDLFEQYRVPVAQRSRIISLIENYPNEITMYVIMNAITQAANEQGLDPAIVDTLLRVGGDIPHTADHRCDSCHRLIHNH